MTLALTHGLSEYGFIFNSTIVIWLQKNMDTEPRVTHLKKCFEISPVKKSVKSFRSENGFLHHSWGKNTMPPCLVEELSTQGTRMRRIRWIRMRRSRHPYNTLREI